MQTMYPHERRVLSALKEQGYSPGVIYDIGASTGIWSEIISSVVPDAEYHLFEPLAETLESYKLDLDSRLRRLPRLKMYPIALDNVNGSAELFISGEGYGSSLFDRGDAGETTGKVIVPKFRLDDFVAQNHLPAPEVIKMDCQGVEDRILAGAAQALRSAKLLFVETWFMRGYGPGTPLLGEIIEILKSHRFSLVELGEGFYDDKHRLYAIDAFFFAESFLETNCL